VKHTSHIGIRFIHKPGKLTDMNHIVERNDSGINVDPIGVTKQGIRGPGDMFEGLRSVEESFVQDFPATVIDVVQATASRAGFRRIGTA
jgi:hypothetical protein